MTADFAARATRLDAAARAVAALPQEARDTAQELASANQEHVSAVLRTIVTCLREDERGRELLYALVDDPEVHAALVKAGIVRQSVAMRAIQVLDGIRPYITGHGGDVELLGIEDGVAKVRLTGACTSCTASSATMSNVVTEALLQHVPELTSVEEVRNAPTPRRTFVPLSAVGRGGADGP